MKSFETFLLETKDDHAGIDKLLQKQAAEIDEKYKNKPKELAFEANIEFILLSAKIMQQEELRLYHEWLMKQF